MTSFRHRAVSAVAWSLASQAGRLAALRLTSLVLARLLAPREFGLLTMVTVLTNFAVLVSDLGIGAALIQRRDVTREQLSSAFWLVLGVATALAAAFALGAPLVARLYGEPTLAPLVVAVSVTLVFDASSTIQRTRMAKALDFRRLSAVEGLALVASSAVAVAMAYRGWGAWSLAAQLVLLSAVPALLVWVVDDWSPRGRLDRAALGRLVPFGLRVSGARAANYWSQNLDNLLVGAVLGASELGAYAAAYSICFFPVQSLTNGLSRALYPMLCLVQEDAARLRSLYLRAVEALAFASFPLMLGLAVTAEPLVATLFGARWSAMVPLLRIFALAGLAQSIAIENNVFGATGRADLRLRVEGLCKVNLIVGIVVGLRWGATGVAAGYAVASLANWYPQVAVAARQLGLTRRGYAGAIAPALGCATAMAALVWLTGALLPSGWPAWARFAALVATGSVVYIALVGAVRPQAYRDAREMLQTASAGLKLRRHVADM
jgi:PST family polysaccharide transporter